MAQAYNYCICSFTHHLSPVFASVLFVLFKYQHCVCYHTLNLITFDLPFVLKLKTMQNQTKYFSVIWFKLYFDYFIHTIQENYIQFIQDLTISRRLVLTSSLYIVKYKILEKYYFGYFCKVGSYKK